MKRLGQFLLILLAASFSVSFAPTDVRAENDVVIHFFYSESCSHCHAEGLLLDELEAQFDNLTVLRYEVTTSEENQALYDLVKAAFDDAPQDYSLVSGVPFTAIGGYAFSGYNDQKGNDLRKMVSRYTNGAYVDVAQKAFDGQMIADGDFDTLLFADGDTVTLPLLGDIAIEDVSLGLAAFVLGLVDGFNPCAMWILIFLITLLANQKNRKRLWILGSAFLFTSAFVYFLVMMAWLQVAVSMAGILWIRILIGLAALGFGGYNLFGYAKSLKVPDIGCEVTDVKQRKKIMDRVRTILAEKNLIPALLGIVVLAVSVNLVEMACSAGLPLLYTQILAYNGLVGSQSLPFILIYIFFFLLDDLIVFTIAMVTLRATGITNKYARISHLIGGIIMILLGFLLIFFPNVIMFNL